MVTVDGYQQGAPCWADIATTDDEGAKEFYGGLFGWEYTAYPMGPPESGLVYYMATLHGGNVVGLMQNPPGVEAPTHWSTYLAVDDADEAVERASAAGGVVVRATDEIPGSGRLAVLEDPEGASISVWQTTGHIGSAVVNEPGAMVWNELHVENVEAVVPFYEAVFGLAAKSTQMGDWGGYTEFLVGERSVAGASADAAGFPRAWLIYFAVEDADAAVTRAEALGATVVSPLEEVPGVGRFATLADPQGGVFAVLAG